MIAMPVSHSFLGLGAGLDVQIMTRSILRVAHAQLVNRKSSSSVFFSLLLPPTVRFLLCLRRSFLSSYEI